MTHLVFYDGECGLCDHVVQFLLEKDKQKEFLFAPLQGKTAKEKLNNMPDEIKKADSLILIEHFGTDKENTLIFGKGALRIAWYLGGPWAILGSLSFFPSFLFDFIYRIVARNRIVLFGKSCTIPSKENQERFLP